MRKTFLLPALIVLMCLSCTKTSNTTNNYTTTIAYAQPTFAVDGVHDIVFTNWFGVSAVLYISVQYIDSVQENVALSLSALPPGIAIDTTWGNNGIPGYNTAINLFDTTIQGATPGTYPMTLTATTASGKQKAYRFNINVQPLPTGFLGKYNSCYAYCDTTAFYADSVYRDPVLLNKIWFANYANSGHAVYGLVSIPGNLAIPNQTFSGLTYNGSGSISAAHAINISISNSCALNLR